MYCTRLKTALIALLALCLTSCWSSRKAVSLTQTSQRHEVSDTVREQVVVEVHDTVRETTTITVQLDTAGDTVRLLQVTERNTIRNSDRIREHTERTLELKDTLSVEKQTDRSVAVAGPNVEIDKNGNVTKRVNRFAQSLKWLFLTLVAIIAIIILIRIKLRR